MRKTEFRKMTSIAAVLIAAMIAVAIAVNASSIKASKDVIELGEKDKEVSFDIIVTADKDFAGAEFGFKPGSGDVKFENIRYDGEFADADTVSKEKNGVRYFGFFTAENKFKAGEHKIATVTCSYDGKDAQKIELTETKLVSVTAEKKTEADKTAKDFTVELKRVVKTDDKPTKPGDKPATPGTDNTKKPDTAGNNKSVDATKSGKKEEGAKVSGAKPGSVQLVGASIKGKSIRFSWKKADGAASYKVSYKKNGARDWEYKTVNETSASIDGMSAKSRISIKVQALNRSGGKEIAGDYSQQQNYIMKTVKLKKVKRAGKALKISWKKVKGAKKYNVECSDSSSFEKSSIVKVNGKKKGAKVKKLVKGRKYFVRVRIEKKIGGLTYFGCWSKVKSVKVRK